MPMECAVQHVLTVYMSSMAGVFYEAGCAYSSRTPVLKSRFLVGSALLIALCFFWVVRLCVFTFLVPCCDVRYDFANNNNKSMFNSFIPPVVIKIKELIN